jgi:hypothetical protein
MDLCSICDVAAVYSNPKLCREYRFEIHKNFISTPTLKFFASFFKKEEKNLFKTNFRLKP